MSETEKSPAIIETQLTQS